MQELNVLYQSDDNYAIYLGVSICSLLENNQEAEKINVYIIDDDITAARKRQISEMIRAYGRHVFFVATNLVTDDRQISEAFAYTGARKNTHSYLKLFVDKLLPDLQGRIVYIDCDTAVTGSIEELLRVDMGSSAIGMALDSLVVDSRCSVGMKPDDNYYNSGVILIDLDKWREKNYSQRIVSHVNNVRVYGTVDQDILNMEFLHEIYTLPVEYNLQPIHLVYPYQMYSEVYKHKEKYYSEREIEEAVKKPKIIHYLRYIGESPWHEGNVHPGTAYFDQYLSKSPWKDYQKKKKKNSMVFKIEKLMYKCLPPKFFLRVFYHIHERMIIKSNQIKK